ncbi:MAG: Asparagine synthetase [glutamine-hydrolyzing] 1 [Alphaproteobacteria bacterium MarineAlpha2_Bin1]|nr:MAG: Asparagine synthetase [glutamine-hydrolyzing] 1 [Alphaproteobacteria bacterium MarineAlpha2_Bin1]
MCGIVGVFDRFNNFSTEELKATVKSMSKRVSHRGPDSSGIWFDNNFGISIGHERLSIIDLSERGSQPMISSDQRYIIAYNGEIYNNDDLRKELAKYKVNFRGNSDTETLLESIRTWGLEKALNKLIGMFAFALWDKKNKTLQLIRDRVGIKPLYWGRFGQIFAFASEIQSFEEIPRIELSINREAIKSLLKYNYIPSPLSIYNNIYKLDPGCILTIDSVGNNKLEKFWDIKVLSNSAISYKDVIQTQEEIEKLIIDSIKRRMISDVPLGAFLSGGIDSSLVVALMQKESIKPIKTFTIGFSNKDYNEATYAKKIAEHLGTDHTEHYITDIEALEIINKLPYIFDEPFADVSQIPTYFVSELAKKSVSVVLSGDGGDEVFAGYTRYLWSNYYSKKVRVIPRIIRTGISEIIRRTPPDIITKIFNLLPNKIRPPQASDRLIKLASILDIDDQLIVYNSLISQWQNPDEIVIGNEEKKFYSDISFSRSKSNVYNMQILDIINYLPNDILTKLDRTSMSLSLEARVPLIDHRIIESAINLPDNMKIHKGQGKKILRDILSKHLPDNFINRPKQGFTVPLGDWLRGPLIEWAEDMLSEEKIIKEGFFEPNTIKHYWNEHKLGSANRQNQLWGILMFQSWITK